MKKHSLWICLLIAGLLTAALPTVSLAEAPAAEVKVEAPAAEVKVEAPAAEVKVEAPAAEIAPEEEKEVRSRYAGTWLSVLPPLVAILLALLTKEVFSSLFVGVVLGGLLASNCDFLKTVDVVMSNGMIAAVSETAGIFIFLVILGILTQLIAATGATAAFGRWAQKHVKSRIGAIFTTFVLGILIFIDDYFNCLTVGNVMIPITDTKRISRAKLAYLVDSTAAPVCMIAPISSWAAAVAQYTDGTGMNSLELFIRSIPFNFYSLLTFLFVIVMAILRFDYGPMALHEKNALEKGDLFTNGGETVDEDFKPVENAHGRVMDMLIPVFFLIVICVLALLYIGGKNGGVGFVSRFSETDATIGLPWGGLLTLALTMFYLIGRGVIDFKDTMKCIPAGFKAMVPAMLILTLAVSLKNMTGLLELKDFIAGIVQGSAPQLKQFLPAVIFLVACVLAFASGTSWGTFGILIPIVVGCFPAVNGAVNPLLFIGISACLAGAVCGDHCSPISDTTIMSSAGARCQHINHVSTQLPYAVTVAAFSFIGFVLCGMSQNWYVVFPVTAVLMVVTLVVMQKFMGYACYKIEER